MPTIGTVSAAEPKPPRKLGQTASKKATGKSSKSSNSCTISVPFEINEHSPPPLPSIQTHADLLVTLFQAHRAQSISRTEAQRDELIRQLVDLRKNYNAVVEENRKLRLKVDGMTRKICTEVKEVGNVTVDSLQQSTLRSMSVHFNEAFTPNRENMTSRCQDIVSVAIANPEMPKEHQSESREGNLSQNMLDESEATFVPGPSESNIEEAGIEPQRVLLANINKREVSRKADVSAASTSASRRPMPCDSGTHDYDTCSSLSDLDSSSSSLSDLDSDSTSTSSPPSRKRKLQGSAEIARAKVKKPFAMQVDESEALKDGGKVKHSLDPRRVILRTLLTKMKTVASSHANIKTDTSSYVSSSSTKKRRTTSIKKVPVLKKTVRPYSRFDGHNYVRESIPVTMYGCVSEAIASCSTSSPRDENRTVTSIGSPAQLLRNTTGAERYFSGDPLLLRTYRNWHDSTQQRTQKE